MEFSESESTIATRSFLAADGDGGPGSNTSTATDRKHHRGNQLHRDNAPVGERYRVGECRFLAFHRNTAFGTTTFYEAGAFPMLFVRTRANNKNVKESVVLRFNNAGSVFCRPASTTKRSDSSLKDQLLPVEPETRVARP